MRTKIPIWLNIVLAAPFLFAGCAGGPAMGDVSGTISIDGKPVEAGAITFIPVDGKSVTAGAEIKAGKYSARVPVGTSKVEIRVPVAGPKRKPYPDSPWESTMEELLPEKYHNQTVLKLDVHPGKNEKDWTLTIK